jgi:hypothetical protein
VGKRFGGEGVRRMLRLLWRVCDAVWARRLGGREVGRGVGVGGRVRMALVGKVLRVAVRPCLLVLVRDRARWCVAEKLVDVVFNVVAKLARCEMAEMRLGASTARPACM